MGSAVIGDGMASMATCARHSRTGKQVPATQNRRRDDDASDVGGFPLFFSGARRCRWNRWTEWDEQCVVGGLQWPAVAHDSRAISSWRLMPRLPCPRQAGTCRLLQSTATRRPRVCGRASPNKPLLALTGLAHAEHLLIPAGFPIFPQATLGRPTAKHSQPCNHRPSINHPSIAPIAGVRDNSSS